MGTRLACAALATIAIAGACTDTDSATNLNPEGPPMIRQLRLSESYVDAFGTYRTRKVFAFGTHPFATESDAHPVTAAAPSGNSIRIVMDELLLGNNLEEISCRGLVDDDPGGESFGRVPVGADPDDVARCAVADDVLRETCRGSDRHSVCICRRADGCFRGTGAVVPAGEPVGVNDLNQDGSADAMRFISDAVGLHCGGFTIPIDLELSYWNPSGDQNPPAMGGFDVLGPAIVLVPSGPLPTGRACNLVFSSEVVDKQGAQVCAPANGAIAAGCAPGDVSAVSFGVEPLLFQSSSPTEGMAGASRTLPLRYRLNAPVDPATLVGITITPAPPVAPTITTAMQEIVLSFSTPLEAQTQYTVTLPATIADTFGQPLLMSRSFRFTTGN